MKYIYRKILFTKITGKLGDFVFWNVGSNSYYARVAYREVTFTEAQLENHNKFLLVDRAYMSLEYFHRKTWRYFATKRKKYTGYSYFMSLNLKRVNQGLDILLYPPI